MSVTDRLPGAQPRVLYPATNCCHRLGANSVLQPPPAAPSDVCARVARTSCGPLLFQTVSLARVPFGFRYSEVPPTATTVLSAAGTWATPSGVAPSFRTSHPYQPSSPVDAVMTMPGWLYFASVAAEWPVSMPPKE